MGLMKHLVTQGTKHDEIRLSIVSQLAPRLNVVLLERRRKVRMGSSANLVRSEEERRREGHGFRLITASVT